MSLVKADNHVSKPPSHNCSIVAWWKWCERYLRKSRKNRWWKPLPWAKGKMCVIDFTLTRWPNTFFSVSKLNQAKNVDLFPAVWKTLNFHWLLLLTFYNLQENRSVNYHYNLKSGILRSYPTSLLTIYYHIPKYICHEGFHLSYWYLYL